MRFKPFIFVLMLCTLAASGLVAQETAETQQTDSIMTVEEAYLSSV